MKPTVGGEIPKAALLQVSTVIVLSFPTHGAIAARIAVKIDVLVDSMMGLAEGNACCRDN